MFSIEECSLVGTITRTHGVNGKVIVKFENDNAFDYELLDSVFVEIKRKLVPFFISDIRISNDSTAIVGFEDIPTDVRAKEILVSKQLYLPQDCVAEESADFSPSKYLGYNFIDINSNQTGVIDDLIEYPKHSVFEASISGEMFLIPAAKDLISNIDIEKKLLYLDLPEGLLTL